MTYIYYLIVLSSSEFYNPVQFGGIFTKEGCEQAIVEIYKNQPDHRYKLICVKQ